MQHGRQPQIRPNLYRRTTNNYKTETSKKRKARKRWQLTRVPHDKQHYNKLAKELKHLLQTLRNEGIQTYLQELTPTEATEYSLWKATRKTKQPQHQIPPIRTNHNTWARTDKKKSHGLRKTPCIGLPTVSISTIGNGRRNHHERTKCPAPDDTTDEENPD